MAVLEATVPELADDAALVVTELVTNAQLHGRLPAELRLLMGDGTVRVEVEDGGRSLPQPGGYGAEAVTGRGLGLVAGLSRAWGVDLLPSGKVVWAELDGRAPAAPRLPVDMARLPVDMATLLAAWADEEDEATITVDLGVVPTRLLLDAKAHVENLVRELTLAAAGADDDPEGLSRHLAGLVEGVVHRFAQPRLAIKRLAAEAMSRGDDVTRLKMSVPASVVEGGRPYLAALDEADRSARASRLLTLATPPTHRVFRRWYVETMTAQVQAAAAGDPLPPLVSFEERLTAELDALAGAQAQASRVVRLQAVTAALAEVTTVQEATRVLLVEGVEALGASGGTVFVVDGDGVAVPAAVGYSDELVRLLAAERPGDNLPATTAARTGRPVWIESRDDRNASFPEMAGLEPDTEAICAVPMTAGSRVLGALRFSFDRAHLFDGEEREFIEALAAQATLALQRSELVAAERAARQEAERLADVLFATAERLRLLQTVTTELTAAVDVDDVARIVVANATAAIGAEGVALFLADADGDDLVLRTGAGAMGSLQARSQLPMSDEMASAFEDRRIVDLPGAEMQVTGGGVLLAPLVVGDHRLGALCMEFRAERQTDRMTQESFLSALADACAQALERALVTERAAASARRLRLLAEASAMLSGTVDHVASLTAVADLLVPVLADGCFIELAQRGGLRPVAVAHRQAALADTARSVLQTERAPVAGTAEGDPSVPVRTGVLARDLGSEDARRLVPGRYRRVLRTIEATSAVVVPLTGRTGTIGAITVAYGGSGRRYGVEELALVEDLGRRAALAVETAMELHRQRGRLAAVTRVAEVAQQAILAPPPARLGALSLSARYMSAAAEAQIGGDLYEVVGRPSSVRLLVGDVRGKGLDAVRTATIVLGEFRSAAAASDDLRSLACQIDERISPYLSSEDFVTAVMAEITDDGTVSVVCCGHPPGLLVHGQTMAELGLSGSLPLGLGADPVPVRAQMEPGDRLLLFTDGLLEARDRSGHFVDTGPLLQRAATGSVNDALDDMLHMLTTEVGGELGDDLAFLLAEYQPADPADPAEVPGSDDADGLGLRSSDCACGSD